MKRLVLLVVVMASLAVPAMAASNSQVFALPYSVRLGDVQLPGGRCEVTWAEASGSQVQLTIKTSDKKTVTVPARVTPEPKTTYIAPVTSEVDGVRHLKGFRTKEATIAIEGSPSPAK